VFDFIGNEYTHNFEFKNHGNRSVHLKEKSKDSNMKTYDLMNMNMNKSQFLTNISDDKLNINYAETYFENYPTFTNNKQKPSLLKSQDGMRSRDNLRIKEKNRAMQFRQNSVKEFSNTLKRVQSKRLTHRGNQKLNELNISTESTKFIKNLNKTQKKIWADANIVNKSPKKKVQKSTERINANTNDNYIPMESKQGAGNDLEINTVFSKSYGPPKNKFGAGYKAALHELKMQWKKNNSSSRGRKKVVKLNPASKVPPQATVWNSNTSRKTPVYNTKFCPPAQRQSKKFLVKENKRFVNLNIRKKKIGDMKPLPPDANIKTDIIKMINIMQKKIPMARIHYRARTTEIGNSIHVKRQTSKKVRSQTNNINRTENTKILIEKKKVLAPLESRHLDQIENCIIVNNN
jgi:hypothetical protein